MKFSKIGSAWHQIHCLMLCLLVATVSMTFAADYSTWAYHKNIYLNTSSTGSSVTANVNAFPVLVRLTSANFTFSEAANGGADIRFAKSNGTSALSYQIEQWDATNQTASIWVKVDTVYGNNATQYFIMYWGAPTGAAATSLSNSAAVFDTSNGFAGVWHLSDTTDATINHNNASAPTASAPICSTGMVGKSYYFNGSSNFLDVPNSSTLDMHQKFSVSLWAKHESGSNPGFNRMVCRKAVWNDSLGWDIDLEANQNSGMSIVTKGTYGYGPDNIVDTVWAEGSWHYVSVVFNNADLSVFGEGKLKANIKLNPLSVIPIDSTCTPYILEGETLFVTCEYLAYDTIYDTTISYKPLDNDLKIRFGATQDGLGWFFGRMDEIRLEKPRPANWIKLCYENQKASQTLVGVGQAIVGVHHTTLMGGPGLIKAGKVQVNVFDMRGRVVINCQLNSSDLVNSTFFSSLLHRQGITGSGVYQVQIRSLENAEHNVLFARKMMLVP